MTSPTILNISSNLLMDQDLSPLSNVTNGSFRYNSTLNLSILNYSQEQEHIQMSNALSKDWLPQAASSPEPSSDITMPILSVSPTDTLSCSKEEIQNMLYQDMKNFIEGFFSRSNHEYPYSQVIRWTVGEEPKLEYTFNLVIQQPTKVYSI